ncbi:hypothetical protein A8H40_01200 [Burkholderia multivorans]|nr:hypothetical protein A8H40_01200 [Burkholderia multivorans]
MAARRSILRRTMPHRARTHARRARRYPRASIARGAAVPQTIDSNACADAQATRAAPRRRA